MWEEQEKKRMHRMRSGEQRRVRRGELGRRGESIQWEKFKANQLKVSAFWQ